MHKFLDDLKQIVGEKYFVTGNSLNERYVHIWKMGEGLQGKCVLLPNSTEQVSRILKICNQHNQSVVIHGGLTNLVGSTETHSDDVVVSMERMNTIEEIDPYSRTMTVQAGVILENILSSAQDNDLLFPMNFGAKGSAQIGGVISTNAGGLKVFKYGMTRNLVLGLEAVLPNGKVISSMKKIIKDNSGYDLKQLFIGSEGTLGVITKAVLRLVEKPKSRVSAFVGLNTYEQVTKLLKFTDRSFAGQLTSYELIWQDAYKLMTSNVKKPLPLGFKYYVLLETSGSSQDKDQERFETVLEEALHLNLYEDAVITYSKNDLDWFWRIREDVHVIASACPNDQHFDVSLPVSLIGDYVDGVLQKLNDHNQVTGAFAFGHVADGNIHFIVGKHLQNQEIINEVNDIIYSPLKSKGGSISAEHGIGLHKKAYLNISRSEEEIELMRTLKNALDPNLILNPGKVINI